MRPYSRNDIGERCVVSGRGTLGFTPGCGWHLTDRWDPTEDQQMTKGEARVALARLLAPCRRATSTYPPDSVLRSWTRDADGSRVVVLGSLTATYAGGGHWHVNVGPDLIAGWVDGAEARRLLREGPKCTHEDHPEGGDDDFSLHDWYGSCVCWDCVEGEQNVLHGRGEPYIANPESWRDS